MSVVQQVWGKVALAFLGVAGVFDYNAGGASAVIGATCTRSTEMEARPATSSWTALEGASKIVALKKGPMYQTAPKQRSEMH